MTKEKPNGPVSALSAAKRMCEASGWRLTNLQLHKILYFAHLFYIGMYEKKLVYGDFKAGQFGPLHAQVYGRLKRFGADMIPDGDHWSTVVDIDEHTNPIEAKHLDYITSEMGKIKPGKLVTQTHKPHTAWNKTYNAGEGEWEVISYESILEEYRTWTK